jgi:hypothetical protein
MPGYGWFCAAAAVLGRTTDVIEIAMIVVLLQVLLYSVAVGLFVSVARPMFGLPIASSTDATTTSKGFGEVMLHRCRLTWRVCMFVFLRRGPKRLEDRRSPQSLM